MGLSTVLNKAKGGLILYNVTFDLSDNRTLLEPYVPLSAGEGEDRTTKRVCLSDSVEGCICALASGNRDLSVGQAIRVRSANTVGIDSSMIIGYNELQKSGRVPDAVENHEYWVLCPIMTSVKDYVISGFSHEFSVNWKSLTADAIRSVAVNFVEKKYCTGVTSYDVYSAVSQFLESRGLYEDSDDFYECICQLPWAQGHKITGLVLG